MSSKSLPTVVAIGGKDESGELHVVNIPRRNVGPKDVRVKIAYCGICHSDIHTVRQEWGKTDFPIVPGHEITGHVEAIGSEVTKFKVGDAVGVGVFVGSCGTCEECKKDIHQYCSGDKEGRHVVETFNSTPNFDDGTGKTSGGYSQAIVVEEQYVLSIPKNLSLAAAAPLLCAGITLWSPIKHYGVKKGDKVGILGLGGLGHMGLKFCVAMEAEVTVISRTAGKSELAKKLGAKEVLITSDKDAMAKANRTFDFIFDTVSAKHDLGEYIPLLKTDGTIVVVGGVPEPLEFYTGWLIGRRVKIGGSLVGGTKETQAMLDFCSKKNIVCEIELIDASQVAKAYDRVMASDVQFRFVIDIEKSLNKDLKIDAPLKPKSKPVLETKKSEKKIDAAAKSDGKCPVIHPKAAASDVISNPYHLLLVTAVVGVLSFAYFNSKK